MATDLSTTIATAAASPQSATADGQSATARSISDLIAADQYLAGKAAAGNRQRGLVFSKIIKPGTQPDNSGSLSFNQGGGY